MATARLRKGETTREALMDAGFRLFATKGYLRTQIGDIVRAAEKSNGVFHIYFKNKDALLDAWLDRCAETVPWYQADASLLLDKAHHFILQSYWSLYESFGPILAALDAAALISEHFRQRQAELQQQGDHAMARMIRQAQSKGRYVSLDPELTAISIAAVIFRFTAYWFSHREQLEARGFDAIAAMAHLDQLYTGVLEAGTTGRREDDLPGSAAIRA